jgi:hypothetical protein
MYSFVLQIVTTEISPKTAGGRWGWKINGIKTASSINLYISQSTICILKGGRWKIETCFLYEKKAG